MTKLFLATLVVLGAVSANAGEQCNPDQNGNCQIVSKYPAPYSGPVFVPADTGMCNPDQASNGCVKVEGKVPQWLIDINAKAPKHWVIENPFPENKGQ